MNCCYTSSQQSYLFILKSIYIFLEIHYLCRSKTHFLSLKVYRAYPNTLPTFPVESILWLHHGRISLITSAAVIGLFPSQVKPNSP